MRGGGSSGIMIYGSEKARREKEDPSGNDVDGGGFERPLEKRRRH